MKLYPFQERGVEFLLSKPKALRGYNRKLLADGMGLGKTVQAIEAGRRMGAKSALIICPSNVKYNWQRKIVEWGWASAKNIHVVTSSTDSIDSKCNFVILNYDLLRYDFIYRQLRERKFRVGIFDEIHRLKEPESKRSRRVLSKENGVAKRCLVKWGLTGTPIPNRPVEGWYIMQAFVPWLLTPYEKWVDFGRRFCNGRHVHKGERGERDPENRSQQYNFKGASHIKDLRRRLKPFMLRRDIKDVFKELPPLVEEVIYFDVDIMNHPEVIAQRDNPMVLRLDDEEFNPEQEMPGTTIRRIIAESKVPQVYQYVSETLDSVDKVVVFTYHRKVTEDLLNLFEDDGIKCAALYGGINAEKKQKLVDNFIADPKLRLFIVQIIAGGEALDGLQKVCSHVIFAEIDWSHGAMQQAKARLYRIGQRYPVIAKFLLAGNTLETIMASVLDGKKYVINQLIKSEITPLMANAEGLLERLVTAVETLAANSVQAGGTTIKATSPIIEDDEDEDDTSKSSKKSNKKPNKPAKPPVDEDEDEESDDDDEEEETSKSKKKDKGSKKTAGPLEELKDLCAAIVKAHPDRDKAKKLVVKTITKTTGADTLNEVSPKKYGKLKEALEEKLTELSDSDEDEE